MTDISGGADVLTPAAMVVLTDRPVVPLSKPLLEALQECERTDRILQVVTSPDSRVTVPLRSAISLRRLQWAVHDNGYYEGLTGRPMRWDGNTFALVPDARDYAPAYTTRPTTPIGGNLALTFQAWHPPDAPLGDHLAHLMRLATGGPPAGWGVTEPLEHLWDPAQLTAHVHTAENRTLIAIGAGGNPAIAMLNFTPLASGTAEETTLTIGYAAEAQPPISILPSLTEAFAAETPITALITQLIPGRRDLTTEPRWTGHAAPIGLAAAGVRTAPPGFDSQCLGSPSAPLTWFPLGDGCSPEHWTRHRQLLDHLRTRPTDKQVG